MVLVLKLVKIDFNRLLGHILSGKNDNANVSELEVLQCVHYILAQSSNGKSPGLLLLYLQIHKKIFQSIHNKQDSFSFILQITIQFS